ncbi:GSCOCG00009068001-RA-CDS [Cotesia congregata]|nr:GSCOCG00009068001-RA-CDS [Cotesia congregata]
MNRNRQLPALGLIYKSSELAGCISVPDLVRVSSLLSNFISLSFDQQIPALNKSHQNAETINIGIVHLRHCNCNYSYRFYRSCTFLSRTTTLFGPIRRRSSVILRIGRAV